MAVVVACGVSWLAAAGRRSVENVFVRGWLGVVLFGRLSRLLGCNGVRLVVVVVDHCVTLCLYWLFGCGCVWLVIYVGRLVVIVAVE